MFVVTIEKTRMGFLGSKTQEEKEASGDETSSCQLPCQGCLDRLAPTGPGKPLQLLGTRLHSSSLPHLMVYLGSLLLTLLSKAALHHSFWPHITTVIANTV